MVKNYLFDTSILLQGPSEAIYGFQDNNIWICGTTLQEIDGEAVTTKQQKGVFCDDLAHVIDTMVERPEGMTAEERTRAPDRIRIRGSGEYPPHCRPGMGGELSNEIGESSCSTVESWRVMIPQLIAF